MGRPPAPPRKKKKRFNKKTILMLCCFVVSLISGVHFKKALFVPNTSVYYKVGTGVSPAADAQVDVSWQMALQRIWENLIIGEKGNFISCQFCVIIVKYFLFMEPGRCRFRRTAM